MASERQPFVGPRPFEKADKEVFFGRDHETTELLSLIVAHPVVLLYAQSGAGKTSLLNAGLIPALEEEGLEVFPPARVSGADIYESERDSIQNVYIFNAMTRWINDSQEPEELHRLSLAEFLANRDHITDEDGLPLLRVIIFDQFEEIFTSHQEFREHRKTFFDQIRIAIEGERGKRPKSGQLKTEHARLKGDPLLRVLLVIREDYLAQMDTYAPQLPEKLRTRFRIERLREEAALAAVTGPLRMTNSQRVFAPGVAEKLVKDLTKIRVETFAGLTEVVMGEFVEPVQLQVVCRRLLEAIPEDITEITEEHLQDFGDVGHALMDFYEECLNKAVSKTGVTEASLRMWFERTLITPAGTRGTVFIGQSESGSTPLSAVKVLEDLHLIRGEWRAGAKWYELTHDRLIEPIQESNRKWMVGRLELEQIRQRLETKAAEWVRLGRSRGGLLDEVELLEVERALANPKAAEMSFSVDLETLVKKSHEAIEEARLEKEAVANRELKLAQAVADEQRQRAEQQSRAAKYSRLFAITLLSMLVILVIGVLISYRKNSQQELERRSQLLAAQSISLRDGQPDLALLLSVEAYATSKTFEARSSLLTGLAYSSNITAFLHGHDNPVNGVAFSPDGKLLASGSGDLGFEEDFDALTGEKNASIILWDVSTQEKRSDLRFDYTDPIVSVAFSPDGSLLASGSKDGEVWIWNVATGQLDWSYNNYHKGPVNSVAFSPDGKTLASGGGDSQIILWDIATGEPRHKLIGHSDAISSVAFSPDGSLLASGSRDTSIILWDTGTGKERDAPLKDHIDKVNTVVFSPDGKTLASGSTDTRIILWDIATRKGNRLATLQPAIHSLAFSPDGSRLVSGTKSGIIIINIATGKGAPLSGYSGSVNSIAFSPDGNRLASGSDDHSVILWSPTARRKLADTLADYPPATSVSVAFNSEGVLALGSWSNGVALWDPAANQLRYLTDPKTSVYSIAFSPARDHNKLAWGDNRGAVFLWDVKAGRQIGDPLIGHSGRVTSLAFSPDGKTLASGSRDKSIILWDVNTGKQRIGPLVGHEDVITSLAFSPDGRTLASGSWDKSVILWDVATGQSNTLGSYNGRVTSIAYSPDGKTLASADRDKSLILWDVDRKQSKRFTGHDANITSLAFSPDGHMLASGGDDRSIVLWNVDSANVEVVMQKLSQPLTGHFEAVTSLAFSADGKTLASGSGESNAVMLWNVNPDYWMKLVCAVANRLMTPAECKQYLGKEEACNSCEN